MNVKFGVSTWVWTSPFATESTTLFPKIKKMGYDVVEIPVEDPELIDAQQVREALDKHQLEAVICGAFGPDRDLTHQNPAVQQQCFDYLEALMDFAEAWETDFIAGPMYSAVGKARLVSADQKKREWALAVQNLHKACNQAADRGLQLAIEPLNRFESDLVNTVGQAKKLIQDIDHPAAKIMVDGFHMSIEEKSLEDAIHTAGHDLIHVQTSENYRGTPGTGQTNWESFYRGVNDVGYEGVISIESFTSDNRQLADAVCIWRPLADDQDQMAEEGLHFLKQTFK